MLNNIFWTVQVDGYWWSKVREKWIKNPEGGCSSNYTKKNKKKILKMLKEAVTYIPEPFKVIVIAKMWNTRKLRREHLGVYVVEYYLTKKFKLRKT